MRPILTLAQFDSLLLLVALAGLLAGVAAGGVLAARRRRLRPLLQGLALGLLGPLAGLAWLLFRWTVRLDPATHYVGLYRPGVIALNVVVFLAAGVGLGLLYRRLFIPQEEESEDGRHNNSLV